MIQLTADQQTQLDLMKAYLFQNLEIDSSEEIGNIFYFMVQGLLYSCVHLEGDNYSYIREYEHDSEDWQGAEIVTLENIVADIQDDLEF